MIYLLSSLTLFLILVVTQINLHRVLVAVGRRTFATIHVITAGALVNMYIQYLLWCTYSPQYSGGNIWLLPVPFSAIVFYIFLFLSYIIYSASPYLRDIGPTQKIITFLMQHGPMKEREIINSLSDEELIYKRISDLERSRWVVRKKDFLSLTPTGKVLAVAILKYRHVLRLKSGG